MDMLKTEEPWIRSRTIGRGSNGTVSLAMRKSVGGFFAVKSVDRRSCLPHQIEALENEIRILKSLSSPYVVEYLGDGVTAEPQSMRNLYMEYLPGGSVADMARSRRHAGVDVDETTIRSFSFCIVSALNYLHSKGIVHCDVKADNVLVGSSPGAAKLADFGSALADKKLLITECRATTAFGDNYRQNHNKILPRGSPLWMAPEVIRGEYQGPDSDVWSLGCTVIEMVTGKPAWEDKGPAETLWRIGYSDELPQLPTQLSELGRDFVEKCLRRDPDRRWSCDQLLKHPFLSLASPPKIPIYPSPRSILDSFDMDDSDEEEESVMIGFPIEKVNDNEEISYFDAKKRINGLISGRVPVWESDGWVAVRSTDEEREEVSSVSGRGCCCGAEDERTASESMELIGVEGEIRRAGAEYAESTWEHCLHSCGGGSQEDRDDNNGANDVVASCSNPLFWSGDFGTDNSSCDKFSRFLLCFFLLAICVQRLSICNKILIFLICRKKFHYVFFLPSF